MEVLAQERRLIMTQHDTTSPALSVSAQGHTYARAQ
jgi:hypothetical protein